MKIIILLCLAVICTAFNATTKNTSQKVTSTGIPSVTNATEESTVKVTSSGETARGTLTKETVSGPSTGETSTGETTSGLSTSTFVSLGEKNNSRYPRVEVTTRGENAASETTSYKRPVEMTYSAQRFSSTEKSLGEWASSESTPSPKTTSVKTTSEITGSNSTSLDVRSSAQGFPLTTEESLPEERTSWGVTSQDNSTVGETAFVSSTLNSTQPKISNLTAYINALVSKYTETTSGETTTPIPVTSTHSSERVTTPKKKPTAPKRKPVTAKPRQIPKPGLGVPKPAKPIPHHSCYFSKNCNSLKWGTRERYQCDVFNEKNHYGDSYGVNIDQVKTMGLVLNSPNKITCTVPCRMYRRGLYHEHFECGGYWCARYGKTVRGKDCLRTHKYGVQTWCMTSDGKWDWTHDPIDIFAGRVCKDVFDDSQYYPM